MAEIPKWIQTLVAGLVIVAALIALGWFLGNYANPETAENITRSILNK